ncbi:MAG: transcriptional regulator [Candidatus Schekmanbacteria bacterium RBG_13_48_7]|uniref:Transcriptional regulator n=1 Tax=Candidatus Schekmanbacteria bacterium RBG_13_48_7 TaxID=1817878 RepID=A0A1F7RQD4_9BACT|nr:MAG: transcriptional regulator [Candidatus Schekmanbacteria bacterium RBG_13_48_7]
MDIKKKSSTMKYLETLAGKKLTLANLLEAIRKSEEISQVKFAQKLGVSKSHLCDIEKGRKTVSPERAALFAEILGYAPDQFVRLSLQSILDEAGLKMKVEVKAA